MSQKRVFNDFKHFRTSGPALTEARSGQSCGLMTWLNPQTESEEKVVVVAGGSNGYKYASSVELLNLNQHEEVPLKSYLNLELNLYCGRVMDTTSSSIHHTFKYATNTEPVSNLPC